MPRVWATRAPSASEASRPVCHSRSIVASTRPRIRSGVWVWSNEVNVTEPFEVARL